MIIKFHCASFRNLRKSFHFCRL